MRGTFKEVGCHHHQ